MGGSGHAKRFALDRAAARHDMLRRVGKRGAAFPRGKHLGEHLRGLGFVSILHKRMRERPCGIERIARTIALDRPPYGERALAKCGVLCPLFRCIKFEGKKLERVRMGSAGFAMIVGDELHPLAEQGDASRLVFVRQ